MPTIRTKPSGKGDAYNLVKAVYEKSPNRSWRSLNAALQGTLHSAIIAGLSFELDDFKAIRADMRGSYWMGNSSGSETGEGYYTQAVEFGHIPACLSFEQMVGRPPAIWAEKVKTPSRLCVGSRFTWEEMIVKVTNLKKDHLIACAYEDNPLAASYGGEWAQGQVRDLDNGYRKIEELKIADDGSMFVRFGAPLDRAETYDHRVPTRRFKITYEQLKAKRKEYDDRRKAALKEIAATESPAALDELMERLHSAGQHAYRHFDIEDIRAAYTAQWETFNKQEAAAHREIKRKEYEQRRAEELERWTEGDETVHGYFSEVRLRVIGEYIETSTGQRVTLASARPLVPWALLHLSRKKFEPVTGKKVDLHEIREFTEAGVVIGCTLIPWSEVERLDRMLADQ